MPLQSYKELIAWQKSITLVSEIYRLTQHFPTAERYGITSQLRRSAVSIPSNIAEGQGRLTRGEFKQFLGHARGSLFELETQLTIAQELGFISGAEANSALARVTELGRIINGLLGSLDRIPQRRV